MLVLLPRVSRRQYLITYTQADESKFSTRERFGKMLEAEFNGDTNLVKADYCVCSREEDQNDDFHYHCTIKLTGCKKWLSVKNIIAKKHGIQVSFSDTYNFYLSAYSYVCKSDQEVAHSENHLPGLLTAASPKTKKSTAGFRAARATKRKSTEGEFSCGVGKKRKNLTNLDLAEFIREKGIKSYAGLLTIAEERRNTGQMDMAKFVFKRNEKILSELVTKTWQTESAKEKLEARKVSRINKMKAHLTSGCVEGCSCQWLQCAKEVLLLNEIDAFQFATSIK